jgi:inner membrane transporter RhtA
MNRDAGVLRPPEGRGRAGAVGLVVIAAVSPQIGAAFAVTLFDELGPAGAAFLRLAFAAVVLWAIWRPKLTGDLRLAGAFGVALGLMNWSFYEALDRIPLAIAVTIEFTGPLLVGVLGTRRPLDMVWIALAAAGIVLLVNPGGGSLDPVGVGFALVAAGCWMAYIYLSKRTGAAFPGGSGLALAMAVGAIIVLPAGLRQGADPRPLSVLLSQAGDALFEPNLLASAFVVALASSVIPYSLELEALRRLPEAVFGVLMSLDPAVAAVVGFVALDQVLGPREIVAIAMVVVASAGATFVSHRAATTGPP